MSSENKGADQLRGYCEADLHLCFHLADCWFSHGAAQMSVIERMFGMLGKMIL